MDFKAGTAKRDLLARREWLNLSFNTTIDCESLRSPNGHLDMDLDGTQERFMAICGGSGLRIRDTQGEAEVTDDLVRRLESVRWYPVDNGLLSCIERGVVSWWDTRQLRRVDQISFEHILTEQSWHPEGRMLAVGSERGIRLLDPIGGLALHSLGPTLPWSNSCWLDDRRLATTTEDQVAIFDIRQMNHQLITTNVRHPTSLHPWHDSLLLLDARGHLWQIFHDQLTMLTEVLGASPPQWTETGLIREIQTLAIPRPEHLILYDLDSGIISEMATGAVGARKVIAAQHPRTIFLLDPLAGRIVHNKLV